jgi:hypothetical protein
MQQQDVSYLIQGVFSLVSLKAGKHWEVSQDEAGEISKPLTNIFEKMDILDKVSNVSDAAMLSMAIISIMLPRVIISAQLSKMKKQEKGGGQDANTRTEASKQSGQAQGNRDANIQPSGAGEQSDFSNVKAICSTGIGFY